MKPRKVITLIVGLTIAWPLASHALEPKQPLKRVGNLDAYVPCPLKPDNLVIRRLGQLGWTERQTMVFECVSTFGRLDQLQALAHELVSRRSDVLMAFSFTFIRALKRETTTIPIVMLAAFDPVGTGLVSNLARPEGNVTGVAWLSLLPKRFELLKEIVPNLRRVAYIGSANFGDTSSPPEVANQKIAASTLGFTWQFFGPAVASDYDEIFARLAAEHFDAAYISTIPFNSQNVSRICQLALRYRIPAVSESSGWAKCGLLLTYGQDVEWTVARAIEYVDKILRGAKPSDLPVEQATKFDLVINLKTAKELGLTVPPSLIASADEVIE
jgi:putative tryptophan/tyrosine transport system substrate-binding protein